MRWGDIFSVIVIDVDFSSITSSGGYASGTFPYVHIPSITIVWGNIFRVMINVEVLDIATGWGDASSTSRHVQTPSIGTRWGNVFSIDASKHGRWGSVSFVFAFCGESSTTLRRWGNIFIVMGDVARLSTSRWGNTCIIVRYDNTPGVRDRWANVLGIINEIEIVNIAMLREEAVVTLRHGNILSNCLSIFGTIFSVEILGISFGISRLARFSRARSQGNICCCML